MTPRGTPRLSSICSALAGPNTWHRCSLITSSSGCRPGWWFTFTSGGACLLFLLTLKGKEDSWHGLWEAGDPGGEERESQEGERHSGHQRWPGQPLRSAHDWTAQEPPPDTAACWKERIKDRLKGLHVTICYYLHAFSTFSKLIPKFHRAPFISFCFFCHCSFHR